VLLEQRHHQLKGDIVEKSFDVNFEYPVVFPAPLSRLCEGVVLASSGSVSI
jgi:hypothetical protein